MALRDWIVATLFFFSVSAYAQTTLRFSGTVVDKEQGNPLIGVSIFIPKLKTGTITDANGNFNIDLERGRYKVVVSFVGFEKISTEVDLSANQSLDFQLVPGTSQLDEIVVTSQSEKSRIRNPQMSINELSVQAIRKIPLVLGEADVIKSIVLMPGVTNGGEASSGFNVRGGAVDQNLILLDEATIFNPSHLFGFFSVFNVDMIEDVKLYKGGIPARYGGRVSSVLDIRQKEGNNEEVKVSGGLGAVASRLSIDGPIIKDKLSFVAGGRGSYAHFFLPLVDFSSSAYFYDVNSKISFRANDKTSFSLSGYLGRDDLEIENSFTNKYGNSVVNFNWDQSWSDNLNGNFYLIYSSYSSGLGLPQEGLLWEARIDNFKARYGLSHFVSKRLQLRYGIDNIYSRFDPGKVRPLNDGSGIVSEDLIQKFSNESAVYLDIEHELTKRLNLQYGVRLSLFLRLGQDRLNLYEYDDPIFFDPFLLIYQEAEPIGFIEPGRNGSMSQFLNWEPRVSLSYAFNDDHSVKASYTRLAQYLHLLSNTSSPTPVDVWTPSGPFVKPQLLDQYAVGSAHSLDNGRFSIETELYYKSIQNRIDYIDGADLIANNAIERVVLNGEARSYGWEVLIRKNHGSITGWASYTLSRSEQRTPGRIPKFDNGRSNKETGINFGNWYNSPFDKTHDLTLFISYEINPNLSINSNFAYQTGQPTNYPIGQFVFQNLTIPYYGPRNRLRLPDYHRLDLSVSYSPSKNQSRDFQSEWVFGIYNVYNRPNAASINFRRNQSTGVNEAVRTSIFGIVPSVTYNFTF